MDDLKLLDSWNLEDLRNLKILREDFEKSDHYCGSSPDRLIAWCLSYEDEDSEKNRILINFLIHTVCKMQTEIDKLNRELLGALFNNER